MRSLCSTALFSVLCFLFTVPTPARAAENPDELAVKAVVERFLTSLGDGDYEAVPALFAPKATVSHPQKVDGKFTMINETFAEWIAARMASPTRPRFREPVNRFDVHLDQGLAFVRADANYIVNDQIKSNNLDYFTLIRMDGVWKIVNASYVSKPVAK